MEFNNRHPGFNFIVFLLIVSSSLGAFKLLTDAERFSNIFLGLSDNVIRLIAIIPLATIVGLLAMYVGKMWGFWLICLTFSIVIWLDIYYRIWYHSVLAFMGFTLLLLFSWLSGFFVNKAS